MADNVRLVTFNGQNVTPQDDALLYEKAVGENGIIYGADLSVSGANTIHIDSGFGIICGRFFEITDSDMVVTLSGSGEINGRVIAHLDLSNTDSPFEIMVQTGSLLPLVQDEDVNIYNGTFEILLATFKVDSLSVSSFVDVKPMVTGGFSKEFIANSQTITEEGYALDARQANASINGTLANTVMNAIKSQLSNNFKGTVFNFGIDSSGRYGYIKAGADSVTPFRNPTGNATTADVLPGKTFSNANGDDLVGAMTATTSPTIATTAATGTKTIAVTTGYYNNISVNQTNAYNAGYNAGKAAGTIQLTKVGTLSNFGYKSSSGNVSSQTGTQTFTVKSTISKYASLTVNNFFFRNVTCNVRAYNTANEYLKLKSYNASTGVLTCEYTVNSSGGSFADKGAYFTADVYCAWVN